MDGAKKCTEEKAYTLYDDLPSRHIRLLRILPDSPTGEICCELVPYPLVRRPSYIALSYAWGSPSSHRKIIVNGEPYTVYENLWRFLNQARKLGSRFSGWLWIDALCINQFDHKDKEQQIVFMPDIYRSADVVMIWLGPEYGGSDTAMRLVNKPVCYWQAKNNVLGVWRKPGGIAIRGICSRRYWRRLWIVQEMMLGQKVEVMCGAMIIPLDSLKNFLFVLHERQPSSRVAENTEYQLIRQSPALEIVKQIREQHDRTLWDLMMGTSSLECVQKLDHVFALLGIATRGKDGIVPDYTLSIPILLNTILKNQHELRAPQTLEEVAGQCGKLEMILGVDNGSMYVLEGHEEFSQIFLDADVGHLPLVHERSGISFWWSVYYGHRAVRSLLRANGIINSQTLLNAAVRPAPGNTVLLKLLLDTSGLDVNETYGYMSLLHYAIRYRLHQVVEMLLKLPDIDVNIKPAYSKRTPLVEAILFGEEKIVAQLLATGEMHIERKDSRGKTALHHAAWHGPSSVAKLKLLLDTGEVDVNSKDEKGDTVLHLVVRNEDLAAVELLLATSQIDVSLLNGRGDTPLRLAVSQRNGPITKLLLAHGADIHPKDGHLLSILDLALQEGNEEVAQLLHETM
ncbi:hypothetical protein ACMFMG_010117 [Clarireedia jacksonii]